MKYVQLLTKLEAHEFKVAHHSLYHVAAFDHLCVMNICECTHLVNSKYCDGSVSGQFDAPVFDQVRLQDARFKHVLHSGAVCL